MDFDFDQHSHRRYNPLSGSWVLVSPHRAQRPWSGAEETVDVAEKPAFDPDCYLCPGNKRAKGDNNPNYESTFVFVNDYAAVKQDQPEYTTSITTCAVVSSYNSLTETLVKEDYLLQAQGVRGKCIKGFVICFSPKHNLTLAEMSATDLIPIIATWRKLLAPIGDLPAHCRQVQLWDARILIHSLAWCTEHVPNEPAQVIKNFLRYKNRFGSNLLLDYAALEIGPQTQSKRVVSMNDDWVCLCPWWAVWPFQTIVIPRRRLINSIAMLEPEEITKLADILSDITVRYDNLFNTSFPYSMGIHQAPLQSSEEERDEFQMHIHFYPPLLRGATIRKFLVGFEMLGEPQRDLTPEQAAERLRSQSTVHYKKQKDKDKIES